MTPTLRALILFAAALLAGCAVPPADGDDVRLVQVAREVPGAEPRWQQAEPDEVGLRVVRAGRALRAQRGMRLAPGDELATGDGAAVLRFRGTGEVVVAPRSLVRVGSLEVLFGRIFADVRGFFQATSENVVAGVEGTRFLFEVGRDRSVHVAVAEGAVACRSRNDAWPTIRLQAMQSLDSRYPNRDAPRIGAADRRELAEAERWLREVADAPARGWCCADGQVEPSWSNRCRGRFATELALAQAMCRPTRPPVPAPVPERREPPPDRREPRPEDPTGWCCAGGKVYPSPRSRCEGDWSATPEPAQRACRPVIR